MPEEINRIATDSISDFLFVTEPSARENLLREGAPKSAIHFVGNTMVDTLLKHRRQATESPILRRLGLEHGDAGAPARYAVLTLHRPSNVDDKAALEPILEALSRVAQTVPIVFPVHPRTRQRIRDFGLERHFDLGGRGADATQGGIRLLDPLGYLDFLRLMSNAALVLTDSGGIQEETTVLGVPCVTLRENTERPVTITHGTNVLAGTAPRGIVRQALKQLGHRVTPRKLQYWDGRAGTRLIRILVRRVN